MKDKDLIELGLLLPLLSVIAYAAIYYSEYGYFTYYKIPKELVEVELSSNSHLIFPFMIFFILIPVLLQPMLSLLIVLIDAKSWKIKLVMALITLVTLFFVRKDLMTFYHKEILILFMSLFLGIVFLFLKKSSNIDEIRTSDYSAIEYINYLAGHSLGKVLIGASFICIVMFNVGLSSAKNKEGELVKSDKRTMLIRKYPSYTLYTISDTTLRVDRIIIQRSTSDIDTLLINAKVED